MPDHPTKHYEDFPIAKVRRIPGMQYRSEENIRPIQDNIKAFGQKFPILCMTLPGTDHVGLISGHRRLQALKNLKKKTVKAMVLDHVTEIEAMQMAVIENLEREAVTQ